MRKTNSVEFVNSMVKRSFRAMYCSGVACLATHLIIGGITLQMAMIIIASTGVVSILTSKIIGLPELNCSGEIIVDRNSIDSSAMVGMKFYEDITPEYIEELLEVGHVNLKVKE